MERAMKIFITGATGFVGTYLVRNMKQLGHEISAVVRSSRSAERLPSGVSIVEGDPTRPGSWQQSVHEHNVVVNLAGASIFTPWTSKARQLILESRILTTRNLVDALRGARKGTLLLSTSAVGYYGGRDDDRVLDESSPPGSDFLAEVGVKWEAEAGRARDFGVRVVLPRFGIVLGKDGGALSRMIPAFKNYAGSALGSGKQWFPWIHEEDLFRIFVFASERNEVEGPVNCVAPASVTNGEFTRTFAKVLKKPLIMPAVPRFILRTILGEFANVLLKGQRAVPRRLLELGFEFRFPTLREALEDLLVRGHGET
jgi:uncharacterized protein (TIGR01777 family)